MKGKNLMQKFIRTPLKISYVLLICFFLLNPIKAQAQLVMGQYEDEAPFRTWNVFGLLTGASLSMGAAHYAHSFDLSAALTNPSQLSQLPQYTAVINGSLSRAAFFKYSIVNTGPVHKENNSSLMLPSLDFGGLSMRLKDWNFALSTSILENYARPSISFEGYTNNYPVEFEQNGLLRNINFALSRNLGKHVSIGLAINYVTGNISKKIEEEYFGGAVIISDNKSHNLQGFYFNGGVTVRITSRLQAAAVFRTPYEKISDSESFLRYKSMITETDIIISSREASTFKQPWILGAGINYNFSEKFRAAVDTTFFNWASYKVTLFGEARPRDFKNILTIGGGFEYMCRPQVSGPLLNIPIWLGFHYDPQPMKNPDSHYFYITFGTGLVLDDFFINAGAALGFENGSESPLDGQRIEITIGYRSEKK